MSDRLEELAQIEESLRKWDPKSRAQLAERLNGMDVSKVRYWYCNRGRECDGEPHTDYPYAHARSDQWPPAGNDWFIWFLMSGRGSGKTRSGAEWCRKISTRVGRMAGVARTGPRFRADMVEGDSGLIRVCEMAGENYTYEPSKKEFTFQSGAKLFGFSAEEPDNLRGPQHGAGWFDEPAHMPLIEDVWSNFTYGLRLPGMPGGAKVLFTSTPLPTKFVKRIAAQETTRLVRVSTMANIRNLDDAFVKNVLNPLMGTRLAQQEIEGMILEDVEGALWKAEWIGQAPNTITPQEMDRVIIAIDPAGTANKRSDETGIVGGGRIGENGYVLGDWSGKMSPQRWAETAMAAYRTLSADAIVVETNFGADMVENTLRTAGFEGRIIKSRAMRGKQLRAEPIVALYEQGRVFHKLGLTTLQEEMLTWVPGTGASPNRVDALVWAFTELFGNELAEVRMASPLGRGGSRPTARASRFTNPISLIKHPGVR